MNQVRQIYFKDLRHYWPYAAASIALLVVYARNDMHSWSLPFGLTGYSGAGVFSIAFLSKTVTVLIPIAWALLIVLAVQADALVGDRQFWITRPYEWRSLLAAKALFVLTVIHLPLLIVDVFLLAKAGFAPTHYIVGLLWMQGMMAMFLVLPCLTLAVLTRTIPQVLLAIATVALFMIGLAWISDKIPNSAFSDPIESIQGILFLGACIAVILTQFARRWTQRSRMIIVELAVAVFLVMVAAPYRAIAFREFPPLNEDGRAPFQLTLIHPNAAQLNGWQANQDEVNINLPFSTSGVAANTIVQVRDFIVRLDAPDGVSWNSGWTSPGVAIFPDTKMATLSFSMKRKSFARMQSSPVKLTLSLAFTTYRYSNETDFVIPPHPFYLQDLGPCVSGFRELHCLEPLHGPRSLLLTTDLSRSTCPLDEKESRSPSGTLGRDWSSSDSEPAEFGLSPVQEIDLRIYILSNPDLRGSSGLCPGTPITISNPQPVGRNQTSVVFENFRISDYAPSRTYSQSDITLTTTGR